MVWERAGRLAGLAGGRSGSPLAHSVGTCLHWASPGFSVGVGLIRGQKFSAASLGACGLVMEAVTSRVGSTARPRHEAGWPRRAGGSSATWCFWGWGGAGRCVHSVEV